jgi:hypothetical protein
VSDSKPTMVPQPHGGALHAGGVPGNRGGVGRPPSEVRRMAREMFAARLPVLDQIAEGRVVLPIQERCPSCGYEPTSDDQEMHERHIERAVRPGEQVRAMEALARVGMSGHVSIDDLKARLIAQVRVMREWADAEGVTNEQMERLRCALDSVWR